MAELIQPPGLPRALEGVLNLSGVAVPVLRLDRLFHLPEQPVTLSSMLIQFHSAARNPSALQGTAETGLAVLVDRVEQVLTVREDALLPAAEEVSFNCCSQASVRVDGTLIHILSPIRILTEKEQDLLGHFTETAARRLHDWQSEVA